MFANFILRKGDHAAIWLDRKLAEERFIERLADADSLFSEADCQIVKDQRKIKVGRLTVQIGGRPYGLYLKRYNAFSLRFKLQSMFSQSGAFRSLRGAAILREANIPSAVPVAAVENRVGGVLSKSFFLSEEIAGGKTADAYWRDELVQPSGRAAMTMRRRFLSQLAALFRSLHGQQIYHNDLKDANILAVAEPNDQSYRFYLLDLEGVRRYARLGEKRKLKNLVQLNRTLGRYLRAPEKMFFLKCYLESSFDDRKRRRELIENVLRESDRLDASKANMAA